MSSGVEPRRRELSLPSRGPGALAVLEFGSPDDPVELVFLHANGFNALTYRSVLAPLADGRRVLALDQRGHGATSLATVVQGRTTWLDLRDDLLALLERLDLADVVLAGHSMGGTVALLAAAEASERARRLVLLDPVVVEPFTSPGPGEGERSIMVEAARRRRAVFPSRAAAIEAYRDKRSFRSWSEAMLTDYVTDGFVDAPEGVRLACEPSWEASGYAAQAHDTLSAFRRSRTPIRILKAEHDSTCRLDGLEDEFTRDGRISIETIPGASHFLPMEQPELARAALLEALQAW